MKEKIKKFIINHCVLFVFVICFILSIILGNLDETINYNNIYGNIALGIGIILLITIFCILKITKKFKDSYKIIFIFTLIFFVYLSYILNTDCHTKQHDSRNLEWQSGGHFAYINYFIEYKHLPDFNPTEKWCFANAPLFHIISGFFVRFQNLIGRNGFQAFEALQFLTLFFAITFDIYVYKILKELGVNKIRNYIILFIGLTPGLIYLSGSLNNDILTAMLSTISIYYTIKWYKNSKLSDLIKLAFSIGFAMMTKINAGVVAIPIGIVFLYKLIKEKEFLKKYICYYSIFAIISLPIGLWYPIRNLIKYDIPLTWVQGSRAGKSDSAYIGNYSLLEQIFTVKFDNLKTINMSLRRDTSDHNIILTTLKSVIVDEKVNYKDNILLTISLYTLFFINVIMLILFIISLFRHKKKFLDIFIELIFIFQMIFYVKYCIDYPYTYTMNFRLIIPTIIPIGYGIGKLCEENEQGKKFVKKLTILQTLMALILIILIK